MMAGAVLLIPGGRVLCAKFAVPVMVDKTITGKLKRRLILLNIRNAL